MFSENNTKDVIVERILSNLDDKVDKSEGSFTRDLASVAALEIEKNYIDLDTALDLVFAQTSTGEYLERRAAEFGVHRKQGEKATTTVVFTGTDGSVIPAGTAVSTDGHLTYYTKAGVTITNGTATVEVEAADVGTIYNVPANTITVIPQQIAGVDSVTNPNAVTNGVDIESEESLLERLLLRVQMPATSGNPYHYLLWAREVNGIGDAKVIPTWNGNNTVKVICISDDKRAITPEKVTEVFHHIEKVRPIGAQVTVVSATELPINVSATVVLKAGYGLQEVTDNISKNIDKYLKDNAFKKDYISYGVIGGLILNSEGVEDYSKLTVNGGTSNVTIGTEQVAVLGSVVVSE